MKVKVKETQEIIDVEFAYTYNYSGRVEKIWQDNFSGELYPASRLEQIEEKIVSLDDVCSVLYDMLHELDINDHTMVGTWEYDSVADFIKNFRKTME